jgi:hypothetical protein
VTLQSQVFQARVRTKRSQLNSIDNMRVDGKFMVGDEIPDGQGSVTQLLEECFDLAYELRNDAEDSSSAEATPAETPQSETPGEPVSATS